MKSSEALRIAILRTDQVLGQFVDRHGDYPEMFEALLETAAALRSPPLELRFGSHDVRGGDLPGARDYHGYLVTGSRSSVYDPEPWIAELAAFLDEVMAAGRKVLGICFGHQLLAHFFGGRTEPAVVGWGVGVQESAMLTEEPWMTPAGRRLNLLASHKDQVTALPHGARLVAGSEFCPIGGFVMGDAALTFQGHPEFRPEYSRDLLVMRRELLGEETYQRGIESLDKETDEVKVAQWMLNFLIGTSAEVAS